MPSVKRRQWFGALRHLQILAQPKSPPTPEVIIPHGSGQPKCQLSSSQLSAIRIRAERLLKQGIDRSFRHFPIDSSAFEVRITAELLNRGVICQALQTGSGATPQNHNQLRNAFKSQKLTPQEAARRGVIARRIAARHVCPPGFRWANSPYYQGVSTCREVTSEIGQAGIPAVMYTMTASAAMVQRSISSTADATHYSRYANAGPIVCRSGAGYVDTYNSLYLGALLPDVDFIMRSTFGHGWQAWTLLPQCTNAKGTTYAYDDMMFNFGMRVFIPVVVQRGNRVAEETIVIGAIAGASNNGFSGLIPSDLPYHRFIGGEFAKRLLIEAKMNGWTIQ